MAATGTCNKCKQALTDKDYSDSNFEFVDNGIQHRECPKQSYSLWQNQFVSAESQDTNQSVGACTINALEIAIRLQLGEPPSVELINNVCIEYISIPVDVIQISTIYRY